jgi:hypothetical protein
VVQAIAGWFIARFGSMIIRKTTYFSNIYTELALSGAVEYFR